MTTVKINYLYLEEAMHHESITQRAGWHFDRVWGGVGPAGLPPWAHSAAHDGLAPGLAHDRASVPAAQCVEADRSPITTTLSRADFLEKYETAVRAIRDGVWPIPTEAWVAHMAVVAGYFDHELQVRVREGLLRAIRWRHHCLAAKIQPIHISTTDEES